MDHTEAVSPPQAPDPALLPPLPVPGQVTTFYAWEGGAARNALLAALALHLAGGDDARPVLVIDWDLDAPALHRYFGPSCAGAAGLLEFLEACRASLHGDGRRPGETDDDLADRTIEAAGWLAHIARADGRRPLYLMRAGRDDDSQAGRAARLDPEALFTACPALFRRFAAGLATRFAHVLVASRSGRSATVSVCSTLLPDRLVGLFTPAPGSLEELEGVVRRAIAYRCSHEDEQRPLMVYPLACSADGARSDPHGRWRRGEARSGVPGYQARLESLLRDCYDWPRMNLDSWFDETQLALADAVSTAGVGAGVAAGGDRRALARLAATLAEWVGAGHFPWQSLDEVRLRAVVAQARAAQRDATGAAADARAGMLAEALARLGESCRRERRRDEARACLDESLALRADCLGEDDPLTRAARAALAALLLESGSLVEARHHHERLVQSCSDQVGVDAPETLAARSRLARTLAGLGEHERALALHEQVVAACARVLGDDHPVTFDCLEDLAQSLMLQHEYGRARILFERALAGRRQRDGSEHADTLRCGQRLAQLLGATGELGNARRMLESVLRAHERHDGPDAAGALAAREALAEILAAQGDLAAVRSIQESLARTRERHLGAGHPDTLHMQLRLASTLGQQGETEGARRLREQVAELRRHLRAAGDPLSLDRYGDTVQAPHGMTASFSASKGVASG